MKLDIAAAGQQIGFTGYNVAFVPTFPQRSAAPELGIDVGHIMTTQVLNRPPDGVTRLRRYQQMHVITHQHIGVNRATMPSSTLSQPGDVCTAIVIAKKDRLPIVPR